MSEFKFECPFCRQHMKCDERLSGRQIQCPTCHHLIRIPASPEALARGEYEPESGRTWITHLAPPHVKAPSNLAVKEKQPPPPPEPSDLEKS